MGLSLPMLLPGAQWTSSVRGFVCYAVNCASYGRSEGRLILLEMVIQSHYLRRSKTRFYWVRLDLQGVVSTIFAGERALLP